IAAVALLIDYTVTVAVQCSAGTAVLASMLPSIRHAPDPLLITVGVVLILIYGNLRGLKEAGSYFAFPTYFYIVMMTGTIIFGVTKKITGSLHRIPLP